MKAHIFVSGFVQGVGYRQFVLRQAQDYNLTGWVTNLPDGRVEILFQGDKNTIQKAIEECRKGPFLSEVEDIAVDWTEDGQDYNDFKIIKE